MNRSSRRVFRLARLLATGLLACTPLFAAESANGTALRAAIHGWTAAVTGGDAETLSATMTEDVELSDSITTVTGRDAAVRSLLGATYGRMVTMTQEVTIADDVAWHVVALAQVQKNGDVHASGQALEIWKRVRGEWKLHRRMVAERTSTRDLLTRPSTSEPVLDRPRK